MTINEMAVEKLNSLIKVNADRKKGYQKAKDHTEDPTLKSLFEQYSMQSGKNIADLKLGVEHYGGVPDNNTTIKGDVYRAWMDVMDGLTTNARKTVLDNCESGEDAAVSSYNKVLEDVHDIDNNMMGTIHKQIQDIVKAHDHIKSLRDKA